MRMRKRSLFSILMVSLILLSITLVVAEKQKYVTVKTPFDYVSTIPDGTPYIQNYSLSIPGGIEDIKAMTLTLNGDWENAIVSGVVNTDEGNVYCSPTVWTTPSTEGYTIRFDCTNATRTEFNKKKTEAGGIINFVEINGIGLEVSKDVDNIWGDIEITYLDRGEGSLKVHGTAYAKGNEATIFLQLLDANKSPLTDRYCTTDVYYPNLTAFLTDEVMTYLPNSDGIYYHKTTELTEGSIHMVSAVCYSPSWSWSDDFSDYSKVKYYDDIIIENNKAHLSFTEGWYNNSWDKRKNITIPSSSVDSDLTDFPLLINIYDEDLHDYTQSDGDDILFTNNNNVKIPHEIERFNQTYNSTHAHLVAWIRTNLTSSSDTDIMIYYNNSGAVSQEDSENTWASKYSMVQHLGESAADTPPQFLDSTSNGIDGSNNNMAGSHSVEGQIDGSIFFDGVDDFIDMGNELIFDDTQPLTISAWFNIDSFANPNPIMGRSNPIGRSDYSMWVYNSTTIMYNYDTNVAGDVNVYWNVSEMNNGTWYYLVMNIFENGTVTPYLDGVALTNKAAPHDDWVSNSFYIGSNDYNEGAYEFLDGIVDEARVLSSTQTADWISASYSNQDNPSSFYSLDSQENKEIETTGFIHSIPINLTEDLWHNFSATYNLNDGTIGFKIKDSSNTTLCSALGNISSCAGNTTPIFLYADLTAPNSTAESPELLEWALISSVAESQETLRGSNELNVISWVDENGFVSIDVTSLVSSIWGYSGLINSNIISQFVSSIWGYTGSIYSGIVNQLKTNVNETNVANYVWNHTGRYIQGEEVILNVSI